MLDPQEIYIIGFALLALGIFQGLVTSKAIKKLLPSKKIIGGFFGLSILILSISQAIHRIGGITNNENSDFLFTAKNIDDLANIVYGFIPKDSFEWIAILILLIIPILTWVSNIEKFYKGLVTAITVIGFVIMGFAIIESEFRDTMVLWFVFYQLGIPMGVLFGSGAFKFTQKLLSRIQFPNFP